jgi:hypothetical protein
MQNPTMKTPIPRCSQLGRYSARMLGKLPQNPPLAGFALKMSDLSATLDTASQAYEQSKLVIIDARVDVKFVDLTTDTEIQSFLRRVETADNKAGGPLFTIVAPEGKTALVKPFGQKQLDVLVNLMGTLKAMAATWPAATQEITVLDGLAKSYKAALLYRDNAWQSARDLRIARNLAKQAFITGYVEISFSVKALYPHDKKMQDLFFDDVENVVEKDIGAEPEPEPAPAATTAAAPPDTGTPKPA